VIKYHGTPISPKEVFEKKMKGYNVLISYVDSRDLTRAKKICNKIILDNGAFSVWKRGISVNWEDYYKWAFTHYDRIEKFIIPDVIGGTEEDNDNLLNEFLNNHKNYKDKAMPVWHTNESLDRLDRLSSMFDYIAFGSAEEHGKVGSKDWTKKMIDVMNHICDKDGNPSFKIHMLRCLNRRVFTKYPFYSGDSVTVGVNYKKYGFDEMMSRMMPYYSPKKWNYVKGIR